MFEDSRAFRSLLCLAALCIGALAGCGSEEAAAPPAPKPPAAPSRADAVPETPADLPNALVLGLAQFPAKMAGKPEPLPARLEFLLREGGVWKVRAVEDSESNVFHKAMLYPTAEGPRVLSVAGSAATVKLWSKNAAGELVAETLWTEDFGGKFSRMRDVEVADLFGDGRATMAVATHDQGVVAILHPDGSGGYEVSEIDREASTFVHEIEIGDLDGDGVLEVYATPSEPNRLDGSVQSGQVVRYVPKTGEGRVVVADLGDRHAKEILVDDVDGDGTDELYVVIEGKLRAGTKQLERGVEVRRYDAGTDPKGGLLIAEVDDRLCRFLTSGDIDGDGRKELVLAAFSSGVWLLRPGDEPGGSWSVDSIDRDSGGFEHAAILTDLDGDGKDELYVASDKHKEVRRYVWNGTRLVRETIYVRPANRSIFTWNLMPVPVGLVPSN